MRVPTSSPVLRPMWRLAGRPWAGPRPEDAVRAAVEVVDSGHPVALDHLPAAGADATAELTALVAGVREAGLAPSCEVTVPVARLGAVGAGALAEEALAAGLGVALAGPLAQLWPLVARLPAAGVVLPVTEPDAAEHCRALAGGRVRLLGRAGRPGGRRGAAADLTFVRCLTVLMAAGGRPGVGTSDPRLVAIAGERAVWNERSPGSWEYVMRWGVRVEQQRRLLAGGHTVRVAVPSGAGR